MTDEQALEAARDLLEDEGDGNAARLVSRERLQILARAYVAQEARARRLVEALQYIAKAGYGNPAPIAKGLADKASEALAEYMMTPLVERLRAGEASGGTNILVAPTLLDEAADRLETMAEALRFAKNAIQLWASFAPTDARDGMEADLAHIDAALAEGRGK